MLRRIHRTDQYSLNLEIHDDTFISPPKEFQRSVLVSKSLKEYAEDLDALHDSAKRFVPGGVTERLDIDRTQKELSDQEIMEDWQIPLMQSMVNAITQSNGDILEIGFGRGISSTMIQEAGAASHTIIECNDSVVDRFHEWKPLMPGENIKLVHGLWQDTIQNLGQFDGLFFHTYPLNKDEYMAYVNGAVTFAEHFFPTAIEHLKDGGAFTYFSNEIDSLSREHQRLLLKYFSSFSVQTISLEVPNDVVDTWWADSMVVIKAIK